MNRKHLLTALAFLCAANLSAQRTPEHPLDIHDMSFADLITALDSWTPGTQPSKVSAMDDQFYISRVRPQQRITGDDDYLVDPTRTSVMVGRKMLMWTPLDDPTATWKALPRYCFEGDNFSLWSYIDFHGNWSAPWIRVTAGLSDAAHKNGVYAGCVISIPYGQYISSWGSDNYSLLFNKLTNDTEYATKFVKLLKYYGIDAVGVNSEFNSSASVMTKLRTFFTNCHKEAEKIGWHFNLIWYDGTSDAGRITFDQGLGTHNQKQFGDKDNIVTDALFFNYNWTNSTLSSSASYAESMGRNPFDLYATFDIQGNAFKNKNANTRWEYLSNNKVSIGFWGAHTQSLLHQSATDDGTSDVAIQKAYLLKQERTFSGGFRNPAWLPSITNDCSLSNADLTRFHGLATFISAKSTIQTVPFVTRFNLGNGLSFRNEGKVAFDSKWYNLNTQDYMPTWRWWITDSDDKISSESELNGLVHAGLTFDDAWWGGSCLQLDGQTSFSRVKLFKTKLAASADERLSLVYKTVNGTQTHAKLFVALRSDINADGTATYKEIAIPDAERQGEWTKFETTLGQLGVTEGNVAMIGIVVENSPANYVMRVGELALRDAAAAPAPVQPTIKEVEVLRGKYNSCDFKIRYASKEESGDEKTYNDEVNTWYYEIWFQQDGGQPQLLTATTSWAAYVVGAPMKSGVDFRHGKFGVRAVGLDGETKSEISWMEKDIPYNTVLADVEADKPIIKPGEEFTIKMKDDMAPAAQSWKVIDPVTGQTVKESGSSKDLTLSIEKEGLYDLEVTDGNGTTTITRGKIQITPESTGAVPEVQTLVSDVTEQEAGKDVKLTYTSRDGEGTVSRALVIADPQMLSIPAETEPGKTYSIGLWFRADKFAHDKQGTNLISKNSIADKWPHNNWGDLWVQIRPEWKGKTQHAANEVSFNVMGWTAHDNPNESMMSTGYSVTPKVWNHIMVTQDDAGNQKMYFNGRKVAETYFSASTRREQLGLSDSRIKYSEPANIYIGGGGVYKAAFNGLIDEVQIWNKVLTDDEVLQAMKGYKEGEVPEGLQGYYTFENIEADGTFKNMGKMADEPAKVVIAANTGGESTSSATYVQQDAHNDQMGYPGIPGSMEIKTTAKWDLGNGGTLKSEENKVATVTYSTEGHKTPSLTLTNNWGESTKALDSYITITVGTGIKAVENNKLVAVPANGGIRLQFAEAGDYQIAFYATNGVVLQNSSVKATAGSEALVTLHDGSKGVVLVKVTKNGRTLATLKVVK